MLDIVNLESLEPLARERLDPMLFDYIAGGADDEWTLAENRQAWSRFRLLPRMLRGVANRSLATTVLGTPVSFPVVVPPMAFHGLCHLEAEEATARSRECRRHHLLREHRLQSESRGDCVRIERPAMVSTLCLSRSRSITQRSLVDHVRRPPDTQRSVSRWDTPIAGNRERDKAQLVARMPLHTWSSATSAVAYRPSPPGVGKGFVAGALHRRTVGSRAHVGRRRLASVDHVDAGARQRHFGAPGCDAGDRARRGGSDCLQPRRPTTRLGAGAGEHARSDRRRGGWTR